MSLEGTLGILGFGNMGSAVLNGLLKTQTVSASNAVVFDVDPSKCEAARGLGVDVAGTPGDLAARSDTLLLAVKPQNMGEALTQVAPGFKTETLVISIAAGISIDYVR